MGQRLAEAEETIAALNEKLASLEKSKGSTGLSVLMPRLCELSPLAPLSILRITQPMPINVLLSNEQHLEKIGMFGCIPSEITNST